MDFQARDGRHHHNERPGAGCGTPWRRGTQQTTLPWPRTARSTRVTKLLLQLLDYSYYVKLKITVLGVFGKKVLYFTGLERWSATKIPFNSHYSSAAPHGPLLLMLNVRSASKSRPRNMTAVTPSTTRPKSRTTLTSFYFIAVQAF